MNSIQPFKTETIDKLKLWLTNMSLKGYIKFYEIFVDNVRTVHKTENVDYFNEYEGWVDENTKCVRVLIYNTKASHRSQVFEFRTSKFITELSKDDLLAVAERKIEELTKRLCDAEQYIQDLELERETVRAKSSGFDLEKLLEYATPIIKQNPQLLDNLGLSGFLNTTNEKKAERVGEVEVTIKRVPNDEKKELSTQTREKIDLLTKADAILSESQRDQLFKLNNFFINNPLYIVTVFELVNNEENKLAA